MTNLSPTVAIVAAAMLVLPMAMASAQTMPPPEGTPPSGQMQPPDPARDAKTKKPKPELNPDGTPKMADPAMVSEPVQPSDTPVAPPPQPQR